MKFDEIIGNSKLKKYFSDCIENKNFSHSYLFLGTEGIGKLLFATEFAKKILCLNNNEENCECKSCKCIENNNHPDFFVLNKEGENIKIDQIREITNKVIENPIVSDKKIYIINDCEKMTVEAQNCLLKTLEEPPEFVIMILISSNEAKILNTIKSRCMKIKFEGIPNDELKKYIIDNLGYKQIDDNMLKTFGGSIGKAILLKDNQEKYIEIEKIVNSIDKTDIIDLLNSSKSIYDKENIYEILEYMLICTYEKVKIDKRYINCIKIINKCQEKLRSNCNFDMCIDDMLLKMWEEFR